MNYCKKGLKSIFTIATIGLVGVMLNAQPSFGWHAICGLNVPAWAIEALLEKCYPGEDCKFGDLDLDGNIGAGDLNIIGQNWQQSGKSYWEGDLTNDGRVDALDLNVLAQIWGS
ncbi:hypothetical protein BVX98_07215 [bacterium F11]|nr:hypothetical protein BVX98_07215 [bacterium F11]